MYHKFDRRFKLTSTFKNEITTVYHLQYNFQLLKNLKIFQIWREGAGGRPVYGRMNLSAISHFGYGHEIKLIN